MSRRKTYPVPEWLTTELQSAMDMFGLGRDWHVYPKVVGMPSGKRGYNGSATSDSTYLNATIELAKNLEPGAITQGVVIHEMGHVAHSEIDRVVEGFILQAIYDDAQREFFRKLYDDALERFLQRLARGLSSVMPTEEAKEK